MGGKGSGGRRPGAGRKPLTDRQRALGGNAGRRGRVLAHPSAPPVPPRALIEEFDAPDDLTFEERRVWTELAPLASAKRTLTTDSQLAFRRLCQHVALEKELSAHPGQRGGADHRGMISRVDAGLLRFELSPCGKAMSVAEPPKAKSKVEQFQ